jgi:hypothetical protein
LLFLQTGYAAGAAQKGAGPKSQNAKESALAAAILAHLAAIAFAVLAHAIAAIALCCLLAAAFHCFFRSLLCHKIHR